MIPAPAPLEEAPPQTPAGKFNALENFISVAALSAMCLLPLIEMISRHTGWLGIPGSAVFVQQLTLWLALLGAALAARSGRLLALSASTFLPDSLRAPARTFISAVLAAVTLCLAWASLELVRAEREAGEILAAGIPKWVSLSILPLGFALITARAIWFAPLDTGTQTPQDERLRHAERRPWQVRALASMGLLIPPLLGFVPALRDLHLLIPGLLAMFLATALGLPIFAVFAGFALLLFWNSGTPAASVPVEIYRLVASPLLPSIPMFTFAGYLMVEGGATKRFLRVFTALFSWMPGGMAIVTVVICAIFTWGGSGLTILSLGGLLVPILIKARYPENFSIGLLTASGSLGLLFPPSIPVILYGVYSQTAIDKLFIGGLLPGLLMVSLVAAWGIQQGIRSKAVRNRFSWREAGEALWEAKWEMLLPVIMLVGLFGGFGTLTEAAALTVFSAFVIECLLYPDLQLRRDYARVAVEAATVVGGVMIILGVALGFTNYLVDAQIPSRLVDWAPAHIHSKYLFLLLLNVFLLLVGSLMDIFAAILVVVPLLRPLVAIYGIDPVQMGIIFLSNLELGYLMPPIGMNLCLSSYRFKKPMITVYKALLPFLCVMILGVLLITYVPWMTTAPLRWFGK